MIDKNKELKVWQRSYHLWWEILGRGLMDFFRDLVIFFLTKLTNGYIMTYIHLMTKI